MRFSVSQESPSVGPRFRTLRLHYGPRIQRSKPRRERSNLKHTIGQWPDPHGGCATLCSSRSSWRDGKGCRRDWSNAVLDWFLELEMRGPSAHPASPLIQAEPVAKPTEPL